jgi:hypothetical protein
MSKNPLEPLTDDEFKILMEHLNEDGFAGLHAYQDWVVAALREWSHLRGRCLCRGSFRCTPCLVELEREDSANSRPHMEHRFDEALHS